MSCTNLARANQTFPPCNRTTNATPIVHTSEPPQITDDACGMFSAFVFANDHNLGQSYWEFRCLVKKLAGATAIVGAVVQLAHSNSASASSWTATMAIVNGQVETTITGEAGKTIDWMIGANSDALCMIGVFQ